ncbi:MAG: UDP-glucose:(heptosyl)LPS alpha-1,3-glucosyltransferase [Methylophagaceae bacterium]|jgi:UDP-glucose:(heptosyl)LPS alpha-1,3-glucosyltransferase
MRVAVCLYKYFPFGGLARDCMNIMTICRDHGYQIDLFVMEYQGEIPKGFNVDVIETRGLTNHKKVAHYIKQLKAKLTHNTYDLVIGFNKIPGLDVYYAADPCYLDRVIGQKSYALMRFNPRCKFYSECEDIVFNRSSHTVALMISNVQRDLFKKRYDTPDERLVMLPPGIDADRRRPDNWQQHRQHYRQQFSITDDQYLLLMVGTGFKTKGLDRSIQAVANLPKKLRLKVRLFIVGEGDTKPYQKLGKQLGVINQIEFLGGRRDIPQLLLAADLLLHPARKENTGTVILEAMVSGLPALVSDVCGYARHVSQAEAGLVLTSPFKQDEFDLKLITMLDNARRGKWSDNALTYADEQDLYSMPSRAASIIEKMAEANRAHYGAS